MKMEVETRVSVQAMRGKFEQKQEDPSGFCTPSPLKPSPSPTRARASSMIIKDRLSSCDHSLSSERTTNSKYDESKHQSRSTKHSSSSISKTKSIFSEIVSPMLAGTKVNKVLSPKKQSVESVDSANSRKISSETHDVTGNSVTGTPVRKISENFSSETKPSVVRRIPVFKAFNGGTCSDDKVSIKKESTEPAGETFSRREKFLGHIRSRSHGNFMIKRDSSVERNGNIQSNLGGNISASENGKAEFLSKKMKQKSSDNLFGHRDSKCASPFEGKQKLVSNVVKNMKNKEKPKVLRKFSFSSKIEKEIKNKKEKASPNNASEVKVSKPSQNLVPCVAKMEAIAKSTTNEKRLSITGSPGTVSVAKAVADIALEKNAARSPESTGNATCASEETSPPSRPPRRRSATSGLLSHKKGMAPSPPGPLLPQNLNKPRTTSPQRYLEDIIPAKPLDQGLLDAEKRKQGSQCTIKSTDSFSPPQSSEVSRENSPVMISQKTPLLQRRKSKSSNNVQDADKLLSEGYCSCDEDTDRLITHKNAEVEEPVKVDIELLPKGPPPKKPPRTFAYDIYRSNKENKSEDDITLKEKSETNETTEVTSPPAGPIYAIPMKKKKSENKLVSKPPVRSNSDLSKRDLIKPSVAPKPPHILKKKRSSVVDPLSCGEKGEEAAMTSEFQRQAHIRYSLRRPKKPPPAPPPNSESEQGALNSSTEESPATKGHLKGCSNSNQSFHKSDNDSGNNPQVLIDRCSPTDSLDMINNSRCTPDSIYQSVISDDTDESDKNTPSFRVTRSSYNLHVPMPYEGNQPLSLGYCPTDSPSPELTGLYRKRSMSDETLYKGPKYGEEPIYAMPIFANSKGSRGHNRQRELHYMCSVLFTDEEADAGRDGGGSSRRNSGDGETPDGNKVKSSIISAWKREFRQSCRQVQNKIKKSVNR